MFSNRIIGVFSWIIFSSCFLLVCRNATDLHMNLILRHLRWFFWVSRDLLLWLINLWISNIKSSLHTQDKLNMIEECYLFYTLVDFLIFCSVTLYISEWNRVEFLFSYYSFSLFGFRVTLASQYKTGE